MISIDSSLNTSSILTALRLYSLSTSCAATGKRSAQETTLYCWNSCPAVRYAFDITPQPIMATLADSIFRMLRFLLVEFWQRSNPVLSFALARRRIRNETSATEKKNCRNYLKKGSEPDWRL